MTTTIGISCFFTLILYVIPAIFKILLENQFSGATYFIGIQALSAGKNLNAILNFFIYTSRHPDIRMGIKWLLQGKNLTEQKMAALSGKQVITTMKKVQKY